MRNEYAKLTFFDCHESLEGESKRYKLREKYWNDPDGHSAASDLYLCLDAFCLDEHFGNPELYDEYDHDLVYKIEILEKWRDSNAANQLWYWLDHKYRRIEGAINLGTVRNFEKSQIEELARKINSDKYGRREFDRHLLADLGTDFDSYLIPRLLKRSYENSKGLPKVLKLLLIFNNGLVGIGVLAPIILMSLSLPKQITLFTAYSIVILFTAFLILFLIRFKEILENEVHVLFKK
jgi:hypothetical protein